MLASTNPLISQGVLNRLLGSVQFVNFPGLNVTASYLGKEGITLRRVTDATDVMDTMTGFVVSPAPYVHVETMIHLLRTQTLAALFEAQMQLTTQLGQIVVRPDSLVHPPYPLSNAVLRTVEPFKFDGSDPSYNVTILGIYYVNSQLWP